MRCSDSGVSIAESISRNRIRDIRQGPDGFFYLTTDEEQGAVLRIEPAD